MRYENPIYMVEDAGAADLIAGGRLQLGISRGSPEQVVDGWRYFGFQPAVGQTDADMGRRHAEVFLDLLRGAGFAQPNPRPMFPNPPGCSASNHIHRQSHINKHRCLWECDDLQTRRRARAKIRATNGSMLTRRYALF
jgi:alkanesulfonate monooxygenase SsuD/methylene tetrahydromethanopterin reductase-like flavin-dependent oxidoreductase (luciferase family)